LTQFSGAVTIDWMGKTMTIGRRAPVVEVWEQIGVQHG
jgi:hypothetical protein